MAKNTQQYKTIFENGIKVLNLALGSETVLRKLGNDIYSTLKATKEAAQEIVAGKVNESLTGDISEEKILKMYEEVTEIDRIEKELRRNANAKTLLEGGFAAEDAAFEKNQSKKTGSNGVRTESSEEEIIQDF